MWTYNNTDELYHYGILGMKWGVRRYQNKDGSLTNAGKKRYYTTGRFGEIILSEKGKKFNKKNTKQFNSYKKSVRHNPILNKNKKFTDNLKLYMESNKKDNEHFLNEREKWLNGDKEYKGKDYYQFKNIAADKWNSTKDSKNERKSYNNIRKEVEKTAKEYPLYNKKYDYLSAMNIHDLDNQTIFIEKRNMGKEVVDSIMWDIRMDAINKQKHFLK